MIGRLRGLEPGMLGWVRCWGVVVVLCSMAAGVCAQEPVTGVVSHEERVARSRAAAAALVGLYDKDRGLFRTTGWWNSANAITALADEARAAGDPSVEWVFADAFRRAQGKFPGFLNDFYDDEGWWALAWIDVYALHPHAPGAGEYLRMSEAIFADMSGGWDETCGGGIWWKKDRHYKNAIANELFLDVAAKLALETKGKQRKGYLAWADREWRWFSQTGMINGEGVINDGLDNSCKNNGRTVWSYNQGVVLGGLASLSRAGKRPDLLPAASGIAHAAIVHLTDAAGVLHDVCEPACGEDGVQFKGVLTRNLGQLEAVAGDPAYRRFLETNADAVWGQARTASNDRFGTVWSGPPVEGNAGAQASALDALVAAVR